MDGQNFNNNQNGTVESTQNNYYQDNLYQDNTANTMNTTVPPVYTQPVQNQNNTQATVSLVMGILSILFSCCCGIGIIFGIIGIVCAISSKKKGQSGMATAGLICSIIGMIFSILAVIYWVLVFALAGTY